jgi:hypothetical protein
MNGMRTWNAQIQKFFFTPMPDTWLAVLRVGLGLVIVLYALSLRADWTYLFAGTGHGLISRNLGEAILSLDGAFIPRLGWLIALSSHIGLPEKTVLFLAWISLVVAGWALIVGLFSRFSAVVAWFVYLCAAKSGGLVTYGVDNFIIIGLFYLMLSPLPDRYSLDRLWLRWNLKNGQLLGFYRRALQMHLCLIYFFGGITKCLGSGWWDGSNIWRAVTRPPFNIIPAEVLFRWKYFLPAIGISICLIETGYPFFIWLKKTRLIWAVCVLGMHMMIGLTMGMYLFALVMIVLNIAAFGPDFSFPSFAILRRLRGPVEQNSVETLPNSLVP